MAIHIDLHVHTKVSKTIPFKMEYLDRTVAQARKVGLHGFAMTEHFHSVDFWEATSAVCKRFPYRDGQLSLPGGFKILTGAELTVKEAADTILVGPLDGLRAMDAHFGGRLSQGYFPPLAEIFEPAHAAGLIVIAAHPCRPGKRLVKVGWELLNQFDAFEVNGKDVANGDFEHGYFQYAARMGKSVVGSSDAHLWAQVGVQRTVVPLHELYLDGLKGCIEHGAVQRITMAGIRTIVHSSKRHKRIIKARMKAEKRAAEARSLFRQRPVLGAVGA